MGGTVMMTGAAAVAAADPSSSPSIILLVWLMPVVVISYLRWYVDMASKLTNNYTTEGYPYNTNT